MPSQLDELFWSVCLSDIRFKIVNSAEIEKLRGIQVFEAVAQVASAAFGGGKKSNRDNTPQSGAEAISMFNAVMNPKAGPNG